MMNETVQRRCAQIAMPEFEEIKKLMEDGSNEENREQEITKIREIHSREEKRDPEFRKRVVQGPLGRRWSRYMNLTETFRAPGLFTWRC
ncbi:MAG: hypothetical protein ACE1Z4_12895 [Gammaproteobacteria bacterium]